MVTNEDVLRFYADKFADEEHCPITAKYLAWMKSGGIALHGPYYNLAIKFKELNKKYNKGDNYDNDEDKDKVFYGRLRNQKFVTFSFLNQNNSPDVFLENTDYYDAALQKWHLYVSWYAYCESGILDNKKLALGKPMSDFKCNELVLWLYEASMPDKNSATYKEIKKRVNKNEDFSDLIKCLKCQTRENIEKWKMKYTYIVKTSILPISKFYLKLDRAAHTLDVYEQDSADFREFYPLRKDFDASDYLLFTLKKSIPCIFGGEDETRTPAGIFQIERVSQSHEEYISSYHPKYEQVKFFGYLVIFEDYFIHSDMYLSDTDSETFTQKKSISLRDNHTSGCIRVSQENLDWLTENIPKGTVIEL